MLSMFRQIGVKPISLQDAICEIYKTNVKILAKQKLSVEKKESVRCEKESYTILKCYENLLAESTKLIVNNLYSEVEKLFLDVVPSFKLEQSFIYRLIKNEIVPNADDNFDFEDVEVSTGSEKFYEIFEESFNVRMDESLGEEILVFKYNDLIKTIDFSSISEGIIRELRLCKIKHLNMIDATKTKA
ncbi:MAG: hypothetical protein ACRC9R_02230 [Enterovibrio sp.]